jgi:tripartite-type tricarboxylate transporter receptor subunit TctC
MHDLPRRNLLLAMACSLLGATVPALAQDYPQRPVKILVPFPAGGANDVVARMVAAKMSAELGQPFVVENRGGAGGQIGTEVVQRSPADGYTLLVTNTGFIQGPLMATRPTYDPQNDFEPISQHNAAPTIFVINPELPAKNLAEFIALVKREPGKHSFGSGGIAQTLHLFGELLNKAAGLEMTHVPFQGELLSVNAIIAGHVSGMFVTVASSRAHVQAGKLRALAATGPTRTPLLPDLPTFRELGHTQFDAVGWYGMLAPRGTPQPIVDRLSKAAINAVNDPDVSARLNALGLAPLGSTSQEMRVAIRRTHDDWKSIMTVTGMIPK